METPALSFLVFCLLAFSGALGQYRMCVDKYQGGRDCVVLSSGDSSVRCIYVTDSVDCALKLQNGQADFGVFTAEEALLASKFVNSDTQVLFELVSGSQQAADGQPPRFKFESVALVKSNHSGGLAGLRGKNYCHPGFQRTQYWTDRVLKELELRVANTECAGRANMTTVENELQALSNFFNSSCRPGNWVLDDWTQDTYRRQFPQLCSLCDRPDTCSYKPGIMSNHYGALDCLFRGSGDIAYVEAASVRSYFGVAGNDNLVYLCKDGSTQPLSTNSPCAWVQQRWDAIVSTNRVASALRPLLSSWLPTTSNRLLAWTNNLANLVLPDTSHFIREVTGSITMQQYIMEGRDIPVPSACQRKLRWCTVSDIEDTKCEWLRQAAVTHGLSPELTCLRGRDKFHCLQQVENNLADIVGIDTDLGYLAKNVYNLNTATYQETTSAGNNVIVPIVKTDSSVSSLKGLVNSKACFPRYGGIAWIAFFESLRNVSVLKDGVCPYGMGARRVFSSVCAPGSSSADHDRHNLNNATDLCGLCTEALARLPTPYSNLTNATGGCWANYSNPLFDDSGALVCLNSGAADVAFVRAGKLQSAIAQLNLPVDSYRILCRDGNKRALTAPVPDNCPLVAVVGGEVVARRNRSKVMTRDINNLMSELDDWFGYAYRNYENIFHIFEEFKDQDGVLLQNNTIALLTSFNTQSSFVSSYDDIKRSAYSCRSAAGSQVASVWAILATTLILTAARM